MEGLQDADSAEDAFVSNPGELLFDRARVLVSGVLTRREPYRVWRQCFPKICSQKPFLGISGRRSTLSPFSSASSSISRSGRRPSVPPRLRPRGSCALCATDSHARPACRRGDPPLVSPASKGHYVHRTTTAPVRHPLLLPLVPSDRIPPVSVQSAYNPSCAR